MTGARQSLLLPVESYSLAVLGAWLSATEPASADRQRPAAIAGIERLGNEGARQWARGKVAWLDGLLGFVREDRGAIQVARAAAARSGYYQADLIERSLAAFDRALAGDRAGAGRDLARLEEYWAEREGGDLTTPDMGIHRLAAAEWLRESGDMAKASRLRRWQEAMQWGWVWTSAGILAALNYLARARLEEAQGSPQLAQEYYRQFLRRYDEPMPSQVHLVEEARPVLARLGQEH